MTTSPRCPACGALIPEGAPFGTCPACLVQSAIEPATTAGPSAQDREHQEEGEDSPGRIGPYRLLRRIGEGGFGEVFEAEQEEPVLRRVALKLLKRGMDTRQVVARFEAERQALAVMDHPHVATVFDAGETPDGRPYFAMELVDGKPITEFCDEHRFSLRDRLLLFMAVCGGVQHAHSKGIIHRDLKPSNVLVTMRDGEPVPKVIDFGVAKATDQILTQKTIYTELGKFVGTPVYMSPEQARGGPDIDTRSDVYSLGALLYELLTGHTPFAHEELRAAGYAEMERILCEEEPSKPSVRLATEGAGNRHSHPLRGDLDWIVMRALEKDPDRRYDTAIGFSKDVQRYLQDEPVEAGPPSRTYLLKKFTRRNKFALGTAAAVAAALVAGTIVSTSQAIRATRAEEEARKQAERAREAELLALEEAKVGDALTNFFTEDVVVKAFGERGFTPEGILAAVGEAEAGLERLEDQPLVQAGGYMLLSRLFAGWGLKEPALQRARRALAIYDRTAGATHDKTLQAVAVLTSQLISLGRWSDADELLATRLPPARRYHGPAHPRVQELLQLGSVILEERGRLAELLPVLRDRLAANWSEHEHWTRLSVTHRSLAEAALRDQREEEAVQHMLSSTALMFVHNRNGGFWQQKDYATAPLRREMAGKGLIPTEWIRSTTMLAAHDPAELLSHLQLSSPARELVVIALLKRRGKTEEALELLEKILADHPGAYLFRHGYGLMLEDAKRAPEALQQVWRALTGAHRAGDHARVRWFAANWNRLRKLLDRPLKATAFPQSKPVTDPATGHYYARLEVPLPWHDAEQACRELGGRLAIVTTAEEDRLLTTSFAGDRMCWLGATDEKEEGVWRWVDGTTLQYTNWGRIQPTGGQHDEHYLAVGKQPKYSIGQHWWAWSLSGWYDHPAHGSLTRKHKGSRMWEVLVVHPLCEWESEEAWRQGTRKND